MRLWNLALLSCAAALGLAVPARAITFNITYDSSVQSYQYYSQVQTACNFVAATLSSQYSDPITINIRVVALNQAGVLGESSAQLLGPYSFSTVRAAMASHATSADDTTALANMTTDPTNGGGIVLARSQAKALGLIGPSTALDGTFYFGTQLPYTFDPANRAVAGAYDFIGVAFHEFSENMGRIPFEGSQGYWTIYDLFHFTKNPVVRNITSSGNGVYFGIDGVTVIKEFNNADGNGGDPDDWASGTNDAFNAFSGSGVANAFSATDVRVMDVIGYNIITCGPTFTTQPVANLSTCPNATAVLTVATASNTDTFQWQKNNVNLTNGPTAGGSVISGTTTATLTISGVTGYDANTYQCIATNSCASSVSSPANLNLGSGPMITGQPSPVAVCPGVPAVFNVFASAAPAPTYQWQKGSVNLTDGPTVTGSVISGSATSQLTITNVQPSDMDSYQCVLVNSCGNATTNPVSLTSGSAPVITAGPNSLETCPTGTPTIQITTSGAPAPTFAWSWIPPHGSSSVPLTEGLNLNPLTGLAEFTATGTATSAVTFSNFVNTKQNGNSIGLTCLVSNSCGNMTSNYSSLYICAADFNCDGQVSVEDIFSFLSAWFSKSPTADINHTGTPTVQDIFSFLSIWFTGC